MSPNLSNQVFTRPLRVLDTSRGPGPWARYVDQAYDEGSAHLTVKFLDATAPLDDVDVVFASDDLHRLLRIKRDTTPTERLDRTRHFVGQLEERGVALVRPVFGPLRPPPPQHAEAAHLVDDATTIFVAVEDSSETRSQERTVSIPSAEWSERFAGYPVRRQTQARVLALSPVGIPPQMASALMSLPARRPGTSVRIAGSHPAVTPGEGITTRMGLLSDAALIEEITAAEIVVIPKIEKLADLHLLMMALTFHRPVVVPDAPQLASLVGDFGADWIVTYRDTVTSEILERAMAHVSRARTSIAPALSERGLRATADRYAAVFGEASKIARAGSRPPL